MRTLRRKDKRSKVFDARQRRLPLCLMLCLLLCLGHTMDVRADDREIAESLAVLPLDRLTSYSSHDWMRTAFSEVLAAKITGASRLRVLDGHDVLQAVRGAEGSVPERISEALARSCGQSLGADLLLWGSLDKQRSHVTLSLTLTRVRNGQKIADIQARGDFEFLWPMLNEAARKVLRTLGRVPGIGQEERLDAQAARDRYSLTLFGRGMCYLHGVARAIDIQSARTVLEQAIRIDPANAMMYYALGVAELAADDKRAAEDAFFNALKNWREYPNAHRRMAHLAEAEGRASDATRHLQAALTIEPSDTWSRYDLAKILADQGRNNAALQEIRLLTARAKEIPLIRRVLKLEARLNAADGDLNGMAQSYEALLDVDPGNRVARLGLAAFYLRQGALAEAETRYMELLEQNPSDPIPHHFIGEIKELQGEKASAIEAFREEGALRPSTTGPWAYLAESYRRQGNIGKVRDAEGMTHVRSPDDPIALNNLAIAHFKQGDYPSSALFLKQAMKLSPGWPLLHQNLCIVRAAMHRRTAALQSCAQAVALDPKLPAAQYQYGLLLAQTGDLPSANSAFEAAVLVDPMLAAGFYNLGGIRWVLGDKKGAAEAFERYLELKPNDPEADELRARVAMMKLQERSGR